MLPKYHIIIGFLFSLAIYYFFQITLIEAGIIFLASFLIDVDHYFLYIFKTGDFSFKNSIKFFYERRKKWLKLPVSKRENYKKAIFVFHGIEFWVLLIILANYVNLIWFALTGIIIHMSLDYLDLIRNKDRLYGKFSQFYVYLTNKRKKDFL